jgi:hypothetical protein
MLPLLLIASTAAAQIPSGNEDWTVRVDGIRMDVLTYRPRCSDPELLLAFHGSKRNAESTRRAARELADQLCVIVLAPEFDEDNFSTSSYQRGGIVARGEVQDAREWTGNIVLDLVAWARRKAGSRLPYSLIGHSAGGQFLSRVAAFVPTEAKRIVIANPSTHVFPTLTVDAPYGMGGVFSDREAETELRRYLARPVTIFLGQSDVGERDLAMGRQARAQGETRYDRGRNAYAAARKLARSRDWHFGWRLVEVPGVGHNAGEMYSSPQAVEALRP